MRFPWKRGTPQMQSAKFREDEYDRDDHVGMYSPSDWGVWNNDLKEVKPDRDKLQDLNGKAYRLFHEELRRQNAPKNFTPGGSFSGRAKDYKSNGKAQANTVNE